MKFLFLILIAFIALAVYVRLAPSDPDRWHVDPSLFAEKGRAGILARMPGKLSDLDGAAQSTPRLSALVGSVSDGHITYVARSRFWGFPDYISVKQIDGDLLIYSRQRFGRSDLGVNAARIALWGNALGLSEPDISMQER